MTQNLTPYEAELISLRSQLEGAMAELYVLRQERSGHERQDKIGRLQKKFDLTPSQAELLLVMSDGKVSSRDRLWPMLKHNDRTNAYEGEGSLKLIDIYVCKIRKAVGKGAIETIWGTGYQLSVEALAEVHAVIAGDPQ